jgi:hypothetical protein
VTPKDAGAKLFRCRHGLAELRLEGKDAAPHAARLISAIQKPGLPQSKWKLEGCDSFRPKLPMDQSTSSERPRKRRAINACVNCRTSKVRCDGKLPCQRCERNDTACRFHDGVRDENVLRIEKLEAEVSELRRKMNNISTPENQALTSTIYPRHIDGSNGTRNATEDGTTTCEQAALWFQRYWLFLANVVKRTNNHTASFLVAYDAASCRCWLY